MEKKTFDYYMFRIIEAGREQIAARHIIVNPENSRAERVMERERRQHYADVADEILDDLCNCVGRDRLEEDDYDLIEAYVQSIWHCEGRKARMNRALLDTDNELIVEEVGRIRKATEEEEQQYIKEIFNLLDLRGGK